MEKEKLEEKLIKFYDDELLGVKDEVLNSLSVKKYGMNSLNFQTV